MRKIIYISATLLFCITLAAKPVSQQKAETIALKFLGLQPETKGAEPIHIVWTGEPMTKVGFGDPAFYVFGREGGGFVIVSGDDCLRPILGYSDESDFIVDNMPDHIAGWFNDLTNMVKQIRSNGVQQSIETGNDWRNVAKKSARTVELETALWNQSWPYNKYTFITSDNGQKIWCPVGCVNTAIAIIMRYHEFPEAGKGVLPDYSYYFSQDRPERFRQSGHELGHKYDWKNMPKENINESYPEYQIEQIAQLMYDVAIMFRSGFFPDGTGVDDSKGFPYPLVNNMFYDSSLKYLFREGYDTEEWEIMIKTDLDEGRPVYYSGTNEQRIGHGWVIDGYDDMGFFRMNWGWGGRQNGYYVISPLQDAALDLTQNHKMIIGIKPYEYDGQVFELSGSSLSNWKYDLNSSFKTSFKVTNKSLSDCSLVYRVVLADKEGNIKEFISEPGMAEVPLFDSVSLTITCKLNTTPDPDDQMMLFYEDNGEWKPVAYTEETVIKMKGASAIEDCTTISYSKESQLLTVTTEKENAIMFYYNPGSFFSRSHDNTGQFSLPLNYSHPDFEMTVRVFNLVESKEFKLKIK
jgi:hypothetical protein